MTMHAPFLSLSLYIYMVQQIPKFIFYCREWPHRQSLFLFFGLQHQQRDAFSHINAAMGRDYAFPQ